MNKNSDVDTAKVGHRSPASVQITQGEAKRKQNGIEQWLTEVDRAKIRRSLNQLIPHTIPRITLNSYYYSHIHNSASSIFRIHPHIHL